MGSSPGMVVLFTVLTLGLLGLGVQPVAAQQQEPEKGQLRQAPDPEFRFDRPSMLAKDTDLFSEGFEEDVSDWTANGSWAIGEPGEPGPLEPNGGSKAGGTVLTGEYPNGASDRLVSPTITLPDISGDDELILSFFEWFKIESEFDDGAVQISTDGGESWTNLDSRDGDSEGWGEEQVNLTEYAGKDVKIGFQLNSNEESTMAGWYLDDLLVFVDEPPLSLNITSLNAGEFPLIFMNAKVNKSGKPKGDLTQSDFSVFEDGVKQTKSFEVVPPEEGGGVRVADFVFVIDRTGSMGDEISDVRDNVTSFVDALTKSDIDYNLGLVTYGDEVTVRQDGILTSDAAKFKDRIDGISASGGGDIPENGIGALQKALSEYSYRSGSQKVFVLMTDATSHLPPDVRDGVSPTPVSLSEITTRLQDAGATTFAAAIDDEIYKGEGSVTSATGGKFFNVTEPIGGILDEIGSTVGNTYVARYETTNDERDGTERTVRLEATDAEGNTASDTETYVVGGAPEIALTDATKTLLDESLTEGNSPTIAANIVDDAGPGVESATLFYRSSDSEEYSSTEMTNSSEDVYEVSIPGDAVVDPGVDFYIRATDGASTVSLPGTSPKTSPFQIAVLPNEAPTIDHTPVSSASPGTEIPVSATITDNTDKVESATLFYRPFGDLVFESTEMSNTSGDNYSATIPSKAVTDGGVEYYLQATDNFGVSTRTGLRSDPLFVEVSEGCPLLWSLKLSVSDAADAGSELTLGRSASATGGLDEACGEDGLPPLSPGEAPDFRFVDDGISGVDLGNGSETDIRPSSEKVPKPEESAIWRVNLQSDNFPVTMTWDKDALAESLADEEVLLMDAGTDGDVLSSSMKEVGTVDIPKTVSAVKIQVGRTDVFEMTLTEGWNFKSIPVQPSESSFGAVMDPCRSAFGYEAGSGYTPIEVENSLHTSQGYWFNCSAGTVEISGIPSSALEVKVAAGWNTIGPFTESVDVGSITSDPSGSIKSSIYGFDPKTGYTVAETLDPMQAYWIKVGSGGTLNLSESSKSGGGVPLASDSRDSRSGIGLEIIDASRNRATLHLMHDLSEKDLTRYGLPPKPPSDVFDVRFANGRQAASFESTGASEQVTYEPLRLQGVEYPVEVRLKRHSQAEIVLLRHGPGGQEQELSSNSPSVTLESGKDLAVALRSVPRDYALEGSYPNPVSDQGTIRYGLPEATKVTIELYDMLGRKVETVVKGQKSAGTHNAEFKAKDLSSGTYFYRMRAEGFTQTRRLVVTR